LFCSARRLNKADFVSVSFTGRNGAGAALTVAVFFLAVVAVFFLIVICF
jgi:hypothetical protein